MIRSFGGTMKIELEPGEKLVEATWKGDNIWYLVEPMDSDYTPKQKTCRCFPILAVSSFSALNNSEPNPQTSEPP